MKLVVPTKDDCEKVRLWRNECLESLRTPYPSTKEMQEDFYRNVICNPNSPHRYWAIRESGEINKIGFADSLVAFGGLTFIEWENRLVQISLIVNPRYRKIGVGEVAVAALLDKAFNYLNLKTVCGECYYCNSAIDFWGKMLNKYNCDFDNGVRLPNRKYWNGKYYDSLYFSIDKKDYVAQ